MQDYSHPKYKDLYKEILKDQQWTWGKFNPFHYPIINKLSRHEQQSNTKTSK